MVNKTKLKIGEFSQMMQVSVKTLRYYEQKKLLMPNEVDEWTGYRYYSVSQMQKLNSIRNWQKLGFSLDEIKEMYEDSTHTPDTNLINEKIEETERLSKCLKERRLQLLHWRNSLKKISKMEKFSIQSLPEIIVASHREVIANYEALGILCCNVIGPEMQRLGCKCPPPGYCYTIEHNKEYSPTGIDIEYCEQVVEAGKDSDIIQFKTIPAVPVAICMKHYGPYDRFYESYVEIFKYIDANGYNICSNSRCSYINGAWNEEDPEKWLTIIQVPVVKL